MFRGAAALALAPGAALASAPATVAIENFSAAGKDLGRTFARIPGEGAELAIRTTGGPSACIGEIRIGRPVPDEDGTAIPPQPVRG